jgi:hypothetical protein
MSTRSAPSEKWEEFPSPPDSTVELFADVYSSGIIPLRSRGPVYVQHVRTYASESTAGNSR